MMRPSTSRRGQGGLGFLLGMRRDPTLIIGINRFLSLQFHREPTIEVFLGGWQPHRIRILLGRIIHPTQGTHNGQNSGRLNEYATTIITTTRTRRRGIGYDHRIVVANTGRTTPHHQHTISGILCDGAFGQRCRLGLGIIIHHRNLRRRRGIIRTRSSFGHDGTLIGWLLLLLLFVVNDALSFVVFALVIQLLYFTLFFPPKILGCNHARMQCVW